MFFFFKQKTAYEMRISDWSSDVCSSDLTRIRLGNGLHDENWLQTLIHDHPAILPVSDIEPGFGDLIAAAREVPCGHGYIDNLYLTPSGDIVLVETKLWRNSQMRREVVAQALDYVAALSRMGYEAFETAVTRGQQAPTQIGRAHVCTPVTNAHIVCRLLL